MNTNNDMTNARENLLAMLDEARKIVTDTTTPHAVPVSLDVKLDEAIRKYNVEHKNTSVDWLAEWNEFLCNPTIDISPTAKPKVLHQFLEKLYAYDSFMKSDATNLYVIGGNQYKNDDETEQALGETGYPKPCVIHLDNQTIVMGPKETPKNPAKHIHYIMSGYEHLATDPNGKRMYVSRDNFREKFQSANFKTIVHTTSEQRVATYEAFFELDDRVLIVMGGENNCPALAQVKKRPALWISNSPYSIPTKLPAIGYAEGEEEPPSKAIFYLDNNNREIEDYIYEKNYTARTVYFSPPNSI